MDQPLTFDDAEARAVSPAEAARMLGLSERSVQRLLARGEVRSITILRTRRIRVSVLRDYLDRREVAAAQPIHLRRQR